MESAVRASVCAAIMFFQSASQSIARASEALAVLMTTALLLADRNFLSASMSLGSPSRADRNWSRSDP